MEKRRAQTGKRCAPPESFREMSPHTVPAKAREEPGAALPWSCRSRRKAFRTAWRHFEDLWREELEDFKRNLQACFPPGSWWPYHCRACWVRQLE